MKSSGIWWGLGAAVVGIGAWLMFGTKKASAQEAPAQTQQLNEPQLDDKGAPAPANLQSFTFDFPSMSEADVARLREWGADPKNAQDFKDELARQARVCLPHGEIFTADIVPAPGEPGRAVLRVVFRYDGQVDPAAATACFARRGV